jgi:predicted RNA-binding Zn-ribbon protein involved in translation (DUF1610 family)
MNWFYQQSDRELGPVSSETLQELAACGVITSGTLVRKSDSADWMAYGEVSVSGPSSGNPSNPTEETIRFHCPGCGRNISTGAEDVGKQADCPACGIKLTIPTASPAAAKPPALPASTPADSSANPAKVSPPAIIPPATDPPPVAASSTPASKPASTPPLPGAVSSQSATAPNPGVPGGKKKQMKPLLIGCGVLLLVGLVGTCGLVSVIVGAAGNAISGSQPTSGGAQTAPYQSGENANQAQPQQYQQAQQPAMMPCMSCKGSGGQKVACKHCRGSRTMQTRNGYVIVCPNCQGLGVATIPCGGCGGRGTVPYSRDNIYAPRNQDYNPDRAPWEH